MKNHHEREYKILQGALPLGKLPSDMLARIIAHAPITDERVILGPGIGLDCAVIDLGEVLLTIKSDPITFAVDEIGWYAVQINANDIATTGAMPQWFVASVLLPEGKTDEALVDNISSQMFNACRELGISFIGGHTEITHGIQRPIIAGTMIGEVARQHLVTPRGASPGDHILLTKGVPIEATAILAREFPHQLEEVLGLEVLREAAGYLHHPGVSVLRDARIAARAGRVTAMHDPTEGGIAMALWELSEACGHYLLVDTRKVTIPEVSATICQVFGLDPLATIASGSLLLTVAAEDAAVICNALNDEGILCTEIGRVEEGPPAVWDAAHDPRKKLLRPERDDITKAYE
jgi:hydrogenase expression/formation protein HypE